MSNVADAQAHEIAAAKLAVDGQVDIASSRTACAFWRWMRMAQMSFGLRGGFWPTSFPLFHDSCLLIASMADSFAVDGSLIFSPHRDGSYRVGRSISWICREA